MMIRCLQLHTHSERWEHFADLCADVDAQF